MKKRKVKRYNGEETSVVEAPDITEESDSERRSKDLLQRQGDVIRESVKPRRRIEEYIRQGERDSTPERTFKQAFAAARGSGAKSFEYGGKRYTTEIASEKKRVRSTAPTPDESEAETARLARQARITESSKKEEGAPGYTVPAALAGASALAAAAKAGMKKSTPSAPRVEPSLGSSRGSSKGMPGGSLKDPYAMQLGSDFDVKRGVKRSMKRMGEDSSGIEFKKGGKVSSASKRADGIAQRGKTRGKVC